MKYPTSTVLLFLLFVFLRLEIAILQDIISIDTVVTTFSGSRTQGGSTNGDLSAARYDAPTSISFNSDHSIAILSDQQACLIRRINIETEMVSTLGGTAYNCNYTDGSSSTSLFHQPRGVAYSPDDSFVLVVDQAGTAIRRYTISDQTWDTVVAPSGLLQNSYDITLDRYGSFALVTEQGSAIIIKFSLEDWAINSVLCGVNQSSGFVDGSLSTNLLRNPHSIIVSRDSTYAVFTDNNALRKVIISTGEVSTLVGNGTKGYQDGNRLSGAMFSNPGGLAFLTASSERYVLVADTDNHCLRLVDMSTGLLSTLAGDTVSATTDGTNTEAQFKSPLSISMAYIADNNIDNDIENEKLDYALISQKLVIRKTTFQYTTTVLETSAPSSADFDNVLLYFILVGLMLVIVGLYCLHDFYVEKRRKRRYIKRRIEIRSKSSDNLHALEDGRGGTDFPSEHKDGSDSDHDPSGDDNRVDEDGGYSKEDETVEETVDETTPLSPRHNHLLDPPKKKKPKPPKPKESLQLETPAASDMKTSSPRPNANTAQDEDKAESSTLISTENPSFLTAVSQSKSSKRTKTKKAPESIQQEGCESKQSFWLTGPKKKKPDKRSDKKDTSGDNKTLKRSASTSSAGVKNKSSSRKDKSMGGVNRASRGRDATRTQMSSMSTVNSNNDSEDLAAQREKFEERKRLKLLKEKDRLEKIMQSRNGGDGI